MKIGILTFHRAYNYGAVLQCYSLLTTLEKMGHDVEVIDYQPLTFKSEYSLLSKVKLKKFNIRGKVSIIIDAVLKYRVYHKRRLMFSSFVSNHLNPTKFKYDDTNYVIKGFDAIIFGSDQIWNPRLTGGFDKVFTGNFPKNGMCFISYAVSTTMPKDISSYNNTYREILSRFDRVSAREEAFTSYLNSLKKDVSVTVLDPVLLQSAREWESIAKNPKVEGHYLLIYTVPQHKNVRIIANNIAKKRNLKVVELVASPQRFTHIGMKQIVSPEEFVGYFMCADYVVTTSFHGTAFSIVFHKPFNVLTFGTDVDSRALNLLSNLGLENRAIPLSRNDYNGENINYYLANAKLSCFIEKSKSYLFSSLTNL